MVLACFLAEDKLVIESHMVAIPADSDSCVECDRCTLSKLVLLKVGNIWVLRRVGLNHTFYQSRALSSNALAHSLPCRVYVSLK